MQRAEWPGRAKQPHYFGVFLFHVAGLLSTRYVLTHCCSVRYDYSEYATPTDTAYGRIAPQQAKYGSTPDIRVINRTAP